MEPVTEINTANDRQAIFIEQVALLYSGLKVALGITLLVAIAIAIVLWPVVEHTPLLIWFVVITALTMTRIATYYLFKSTKHAQLSAQNWYLIFNAGVFLASLAWCAVLIALFPEENVKHQAFIIIALVGMCSGGVTTLSFRRESTLLFIVPILLVLGWRFASQGETWGVGLALASILYFIGLVVSSLHIYRYTKQNIELRLASRKQSEARKKSEQRLRSILDTEADAFFLHDIKGKLIDVNQKACESLGYSKEELLHLNFSDIELTTIKADVQSYWGELKQNKTITVTGIHCRKDGESFPIEARIGVLYEGGEKLFSVLARDTSERKKVEDALHLSEEQARAQYKGIPVPTYTWQLKGDDFELVNFNDAAENYTRGDVVKAVGNKLSVMYKSMPEIESDIWQCYKQKKPIQKQMPYYYQSFQQTRHLDVKYAFVPDDIVMVHTEDITERINSENELHEKQVQLEEAQHIAHLGNWDWDLMTGKIIWSDEVFRILGYMKGKDEANQENFIKVLHPDDMQLMSESEQRAYQGEIKFDEEWRIITPQGQLKYINLRGNRIFNEQRQPIRMVGTMQDITERKQAEIHKNEFISSVSHELRTPLTSIMGSLSIIDSGTLGKLPAEINKLIKIANENAQRLLHLINDILDVAKIEAGEFQLHPEPVNLLELVEESVQLNEGYANKYLTHIKLDNQISPDLEVNADKERIIQVMNNFLSNAMKFNRPDTDIEVILSRHQQLVRVAVKDHGEGIEQDFIPHVFKRFTQSDASTTRKTGGTGLGLNISKQIIEAHHGTIDFKTGNDGTVFYFELPLSVMRN
ncbi:MAG: PAS domain S-box protein [Gammaproteobacteria bacterium]|nr:PAS domain S-box protein [Gammaproteobacteria bacterium]